MGGLRALKGAMRDETRAEEADDGGREEEKGKKGEIVASLRLPVSLFYF